MEEEFGIFGPVNLGAKPFDLSTKFNAPSVSSPITSNGDSAMDIFNSLLNEASPKTGQGSFSVVPTAGLDVSGRYPKIFPGLDNESLYAQNQGAVEKLSNGLIKMTGIAGTTFLNTTVGTLYGLKEWRNTGEFKSVFDNPLTRELNEFNNEYLESTFANYKTQREREGDWWEPDNLFTANFLADNIIKNLGFAAGAFAGGFAWTGALRALGLSGRLIAQGKNMAAATDAAISSASALPQAQRLSAINTALNQLSSTARVATGKAFMGAERGIVSTIAAAGEAGIEALGASQEFRQSMIDKYIADNGFNPTGADLQEINDTATDAGKTVYGLNFGLLSISNFVQLPKIFSSTFKGEKNLINNVAFKGGKWASTLPEKGLKASLYKARGVGKLLFNTDEALEEAAQYAAQVGTENYFSKLNETGEASVLDDLFFAGAKDAFTSSEGLLNFTIGGISGAIMGGPSRIGQKGIDGYGGKEGKARKEFTDAWNKSLIKEKLKDKAKAINANEKIQKERAQKIVDGDISGAKDLEFDFLFGDMYNRVKYASLENVNQETNELRQLASTDEGFLQLQQEEIAYDTDTRESFLNRLSGIERQAKQIDQIYQDTNLKFKGIVDKDNKPVYNDEVIKKLTYAAAKVYDYDNRIPSLNNKLITAGVNTTDLFNEVITNGKPTKETVDKTLATLNNPVNADELTQELIELAELGIKRKKFLDEYTEIKTNPKKYTPAPEKPATVIPEEQIGQKVKIVTKDGDKEYSIGEEYYLGKVVEYDAKGKEVYRFPKLTILGQNEDGTIKIRDSKGERDIDPELLKDYKLGKVSNVASNPMASFYMENINKIVKWNTGKDKGGIISGRLEYDSEKNQLMFTYATKSKKGKRYIKSVPIGTNPKDPLAAFRPKKGYDKGIFYFEGQLTSVSKEKIEAAKNQPKEAEKLYDVNTQQARQELLSDYQKEVVEKQAEINEMIRQRKADIATIEEDLSKLNATIEKGGDDVRAKRGTRLKSSVRKALETSMRLSRARQEILEEIEELEAQRQEGELIMSYLEDSIDNIKELEGGGKAVIDQLEFEVELLKESIEETGKQISVMATLMENLESIIDTAVDFLRNLIDQFETNYPKVPRIMGFEFNEFLKANPNFLKIKPNYISDLRQLDTFIAEVEDMEIVPSEQKLNKLRTEVDSLKKFLESDTNELKFKEALLEKMKKAYKDYQASGIEEEKLMKNEQLKKQILGTEDKENPVPIIHDKEYEPAFKKPLEIIPRATLGIDRGKPHQKRAQKFGSNFRNFTSGVKENIRGIYITHKNQDQLIPGLMNHLRTDESGVKETVDPNRIIAMVMVDISSGSPVLVDQNGQPLTEEQLQDPLNHSVYQVFPLEELQWSGEYGGESMFPKDIDDNVRSEVKLQYAKWRNETLAVEDLSEVHTVEVSFGIPQIQKDVDGNKLYDTTTSVEDAGLVSNWQLENEPVITVIVNNDDVVRGVSKIKTSPGRVFLEMDNGLVPLNNREHTKKEAEVIFDAILQFSKNMFDKSKGINNSETQTLLTFLKSVVYWGIPKNDPGFNSVFFKDGKLFMSGKGESFPFTPSGLLNNRDVIIEVLGGMYHSVNATMSRDPNKNYVQITSISEDGTIQSVTWPNYQSYLLSTETPDGKKRSGEQLPLSTNIRPLENADDVNITGIYFYTKDTGEYFSFPEAKKVSKVIVPVAPKAKTEGKPTEWILDGKAENQLVTKSGGIIRFSSPEVIKSINDITIYPNDFSKQTMADLKKQYSEDEAKNIIKQGVVKAVQDYLKANGPGKSELKSTGKASDGEEVFTFDEEETTETVETSGEIVVEEEKDEDVEDEEFTFDEDDLDSFNNPDKVEGYEELREMTLNEAKGFDLEDWTEVEAAWKKMLPNVPLYRLKNIIKATNGKQAWGMLKNGAIYLYQNAEVGTFYHEVFEAVWKMFTDPAEQASIINEFKSRTGTFVDRPTGQTLKYSEATPQQIKEQLAEEFRDYLMLNKIPAKPKDGRSWIVKLYSDIVNTIKKLFTGKDANLNVEELFKRIGDGYYAKQTPEMGVLQNVSSQIIDIDNVVATDKDELREKLTFKQMNEVIQHMTYTTLSKLVKTNQSLFKIMDLKKTELYAELKQVIISRLGIKNQANEQNYKEGKISKKEYEDEKKLIFETFKNVSAEWDTIVKKHIEYLKAYQIDFDENDEIQINEEDKTREISPDATKIDSLRKANTAIKLLLATQPRVMKVPGKTEPTPVLTSIAGVELLPMSQTFITVMNEVHTSRDVQEMMNRLRMLAQKDANYYTLYSRVSNGQSLNAAFDFQKLTDVHQVQLVSSLWSVFKKQNPSVKNVFILEGGQVVIGDANLSKASAQIARDFENSMVLSAKKGDGYFKKSVEQKAFVVDAKIDKVVFTASSAGGIDGAMLSFLENIGIQFSKAEFSKLSLEDQIKFRESVSGMRDSLKATKILVTFSDKKMDVRGRLLTLGFLKHKASHPETESTYFNVSNEKTQTFIGTNPLSDLQDFITSTSDLNSNDVKQSQYKYLIYDTFSKGSLILKKLFPKDKTSDKRLKVSEKNSNHDLLTVGIVGGTINNDNGKQKPSSKLNYMERLVQEINLNLEGWYLNLVPGDASIEWMIKMGNHVSSTDMATGFNAVHEIFKDYFIDEFELAKSPDRTVSKKRNKNNLRFFFDILGEQLNNEIIKSDKKTGQEAYVAFEKKIKQAVEKYITDDAKSLQTTLESYGVIKASESGFSMKNITSSSQMYSISENMSSDLLSNNMKALTVNYMIANIELHKVIYSDPYQYADELKRIKSFSSPRQAILADSDNISKGKGINSVLNTIWNAGYNKTDLGYTDMNRNYFKTVTHTDVIGVVDIPNQEYEEYKETDGSGIISMKAHRNLRIRSSNWSEAEEKQYRHDVAYEELVRSDANQSAINKFEESNPGVKSAYTPSKPIVAGNSADGQAYNNVVLDKFALYPLSFRILHQIKADSNAMKLYDKMQKEDIDYIVFDSGRKVGAKNSHKTYTDKGEFNNQLYVTTGDNRNVINVPFQIIAIQADVPSKDVALVGRGSQITKLLTMDFMAAGVPVDFLPKEGDFTKRYKEWYSLKDESERESKSSIYTEIKNNQRLLKELTKVGYDSLLKRMGISKVGKGFKITDFSIPAKTLRDEVLKREVNENVLKSLDSFLNGKSILEATPAYHQIRNIIYSIVDKEVVSQKISGGMKVQIPSTFLLDSGDIKVETINGKTGFVSETLKFYEKDGERVAEVMIGRWFQSDLSDDALLDYFNNDPEGKKQMSALFGVAFRIPTQNANSIDAIKIAKFLPKEFGDSVVIPSALVAKVGSDFDIDKLSIYLKNVFKDATGEIKLVPFYGYGQEAVNKFKELSRSITEEKIEIRESKLLNQNKLQNIFGDIALGLSSDKMTKKWIPIFRQWFANELVNDQLPVKLIEEIFMSRIDKLNKKIDKLTEKDLQDIFIDEHADRLYKASLENEYIQSSENLIKSDYNYDKLMTPNSADQLKALGTFIAEKTTGGSYDYQKVGNMLNRKFMSSLRHAFVTGKYAIGIAAVNQTNHSLMQRFPSFVDPERLGRVSQEDRHWLGDAKVKFQNFNRIDGKATLSMIKNAAGDFISDIIGQFIDGYVDISKGPWIMELGATPNVASTWLFLVKIGVPIEDVAYFMNQPIIREYLKNIESAGYSWLFMDNFVEDIMSTYNPNQKSIASRTTLPSTKNLKDNVGKKVSDMSADQKADQQFILNEFLKYAKMASHMFEVTQGSNYDTANFNDGYLLYKKKEQFKKAQKTIISSVEDILNNSFIGDLVEYLGDSVTAMSEMLIADRYKFRNEVYKVLQPYTNLPDREFVKLAQKIVADMFDYAVQTNTKVRNSVYKVMVADGGYAYDISKMVEVVKNDPKHPLHNNAVISIFSSDLSKSATDTVNNIVLKGVSNKIYDQNNIINGFQEIKEYFTGIGKPEMYDKFKLLAFFQSGLSVNRFSFTSLLPYEDFEKIYSATIQKIESISNLGTFASLHVFERNNWGNDDIVPSMKAQLILKPGQDPIYNPSMKFYGNPKVSAAVSKGDVQPLVSINSRTKEGNSEFVTYSWEDESIPYTKRKEMKKIGDYSYIKKGLFQKVRNSITGDILSTTYKEKTYYVYKAVNAWGARERAQEFYDVEKPSEIDNGFIKVMSVASDEKIIGLFDPSKIEKGVTATVTTAPAASETSIVMQPKNINKILSGQKTMTTRQSIASGGNIPIGQTKVVNFGGKKFNVTNRGYLSIQEAGGLQSVLKAEGVSSTNDFSFDYTKEWAKGNGKMYVFDISPVTQTKTQTPKEGEMKLKNGKTYPHSKINSKMLEVIGYSPEEIGKILETIIC